MDELTVTLRKFARRVRLVRAWRGLAVGAAVGAVGSVLLAVLDYFGVYYTSWLMLAVPVAVGALCGLILGFLRRVPVEGLADSVDRRGALEDRVRSALECGGRHGEFDDALLSDALQRLRGVRPARAYPIRAYRWHAALPALGALAATIFILGNSLVFVGDDERHDREQLRQVAEQVERIAKPLLARGENASQEEEDLAQALQRFSRDLERGRLPKADALAKANEPARQADELARKRFKRAEESALDAQTALARLALEEQRKETGKLPPISPEDLDLQTSGDELQQQHDALQSRMDALRGQMASGNLSAEQVAGLQAEMDRLARQMRQIELSQKAREFLERLARQPEYRELLKMMRTLQQAAQDGRNGDPGLTEEQVKEMIKRLEELADRFKTDEQLREFIERLKEAAKNAEYG